MKKQDNSLPTELKSSLKVVAALLAFTLLSALAAPAHAEEESVKDVIKWLCEERGGTGCHK